MNYYELKEIRRHGEEMLPIAAYDINAQSGLRYLSCHWHEEMELFKLQKGCMKMQCGDHFFYAQEGSVLFFNSGEIHAAEPVTEAHIEYRAVVFSPEFLCGSDVVRSKYIGPILKGRMVLPTVLGEGGAAAERFDRLYELMQKREFGYELSAKAILLEMVAAALPACELQPLPQGTGSSAACIKQAIGYIQENYRRPITIEELAERCNMSQGHFCRLFKQYTLKTPVQYVNNLRISKAIELLISGNRKILDIALDTGFNGLSYFIGVFKESVGVTPTKFRKEYGNKREEKSEE